MFGKINFSETSYAENQLRVQWTLFHKPTTGEYPLLCQFPPRILKKPITCY